MINIIVAFSKSNRVMGKNGKIPWRIPDDISLFKSITDNNTVLMGRKTWDSIPLKFRPLKNRHNIVITKNPDPYIPLPAHSLMRGLEIAQELGNIVYVIGGESIYRQCLDIGIVDNIFASEIYQSYEGDTFFPKLDSNWNISIIRAYNEFDFIKYEKIK
jgi:dihydrofolate reductase